MTGSKDRPQGRALPAVDTILATLEELQLITAAQRQRGGPDLESVLTTLSEEPAWWSLLSAHGREDGDLSPTLSAYQTRMIRKHADNLRQLRASLRVGNAIVLRQIGKGGMGLVYQGWDLLRQRFVAIKRMRRDGSRVLLRRFRKERKVLQKLRHPRIVRLLEYIKTRRSETLIMQYLRGHTLDREIAAHTRVPWPDVVRWAIDLLEALQYAHERNIIHRDIKPTNLMLHRKGPGQRVAILLDVGLAKNLDPVSDEAESVSLMETQAGQLLGTFLYMSPEQWSGKAVFASDVYSLGATLFHALTGTPPFTGKEPALGSGGQPSYVRMCRAHTDLKPPRLRDRCPDLPEELDHLLNGMLEKQPERRATIALLLVAFRRLLARGAEPVPTPSRPLPVVPPTSPTTPARLEPARKKPTRPALAAPEEAPLPDEEEANDSLPSALGGLIHSVWGYLHQDKEARSSTIFATPGEQLRRSWQRVKHQASEWLVSLAQPGRYPGRFAVALLLVVILGGGIYWLLR